MVLVKLVFDDGSFTWTRALPHDPKTIPLEHLPLSIRVYNSLRRAGINTLEELLQRDPSDLVKIRNFPVDRFHELQSAINYFLRENSVSLPETVIDYHAKHCEKCGDYGMIRDDWGICDACQAEVEAIMADIAKECDDRCLVGLRPGLY
jgi:hypothetical protein